jgi:uncharacterized metal-binding protein YceD (DUF177 family)
MIFLQPTLEPMRITLSYDEIQSEDILSIEPFEITYQILKRQQLLVLHVTSQVTLTLACSKTLKPVLHTLDIDDDIAFGNLDDADFVVEDAIDLDALVMGLIVSLKPIVIYHPDAKHITFEEEKKPNIFETLLKK